MLPYHLIDGYNLLHAAGLARAAYAQGDLERARSRLLGTLADGLKEGERLRTTVVFDAADPPPDAPRSLRHRDLTVLFATGAPDADTVIEELIRSHPAPRQLRVVSDDRRLQQAAKRRGAKAVGCETFLRRLSREEHEPRTVPAASGEVAAGDSVGDWLDFFGIEGPISLAEPPPTMEPAAQPATAGRPVPAAPPPAAPGAPRRPSRSPAITAVPTPDEPPAEDERFWQQRIDALIAEESRRASPPPRPRPG